MEPDIEGIKFHSGVQVEKEAEKANVGPSVNGNGVVKKEEGKGRVKEYPRGESPADTKPPPDKKRKKSSENGAKGKEAARSSKKEKKEPKVEEKKKPAVEPKKKSDTAKVTKPKVQYDMPGQTQPTPNSGEPLARFYTSLREQRPKSEISNKWCAIIESILSCCTLALFWSSRHNFLAGHHLLECLLAKDMRGL